MSINVNCFDLIEIKYLDENQKEKIEFFHGTLDLAKEFVTDAGKKGFEILSATYFIELMISHTGSATATQPHKRFGEKILTAAELLSLPSGWVEEMRLAVNAEIDSYIKKRYGADSVK
jgi:hypothetical protein